MKPIKNINSKDSHQLMSGIQRQSKLEQGFLMVVSERVPF